MKLFGYFQYSIQLDAWVQNRINNKGVAFYTTPQQRKPLTRQQCLHLDVHPLMTIEQVVRVVEAAHGIKGDA